MIIGRENELQLLHEAYRSDYSEFVAVYGRRRVGKTFLIREAFNYKFTFQHSGLANSNKDEQLAEWQTSLEKHGMKNAKLPKNWREAFSMLDELIRHSRAKKKIIFLDELPWMDTQNSNFVSALEHFWNGYASARKDVLLIVCGSATSWIVNKIFKNHGALYNRVTVKIHLHPFCLSECKKYADSLKLKLSLRQIMEGYMIMGGIPFYWSFLRRGLSLAQNIDRMFFSPDADLEEEFEALYASLFKNPSPYIQVVTVLSSTQQGMGRNEIAKKSHLPNNGNLTIILKDLEYSGFIRKYQIIGKKSHNSLYQLIDFYTIFYFKFLAGNKRHDKNFWTKNQSANQHLTWCGLAFERVCLLHVDQIKKALSIGGVISSEYSWRSVKAGAKDKQGAQIDLLIDRNDDVIDLCEMKYTIGEYSISKKEEANIINRKARFIEETKTRKAIHTALITTIGLAQNEHSDIIDNTIIMSDLFK